MKEKVSALLDGALDDEASARMFESLKRDGALRREWENYCLIGDVLRDEEPLSSDFTRNVMRCLDDEPTVLRPSPQPRGAGLVRHFMPIAASVMGVAAVGWVAMTLNGAGSEPVPKVAAIKAPPVAVAAAPAQAPAESSQRAASTSGEPSDREYVFAHQAMAPSASMPGVAMYVRTVSDTRTAGER